MGNSLKHWLIVLGLLISSTAWADNISVTITGTGGTVQNGVYVAPYYLTVSGAGSPSQGIYSGSTITVICDDYTHDVTLGPPATAWQAQINDLTTASLTNARFDTTSDAQRRYEEAAYLAMKTGLWGGGFTLQSPSMIGEYNWAIWSLFDPSLVIDSTAKGLLQDAALNAPANNPSYYAGVRILTPVAHLDGTPWTDSTSPQEYITIVHVPEPASVALLGSGLLALFFGNRKKRLLNS